MKDPLDTIEYVIDKDVVKRRVYSETTIKSISEEFRTQYTMKENMKKGVSDTPEDQTLIDISVANIENEIAKLEALIPEKEVIDIKAEADFNVDDLASTSINPIFDKIH